MLRVRNLRVQMNGKNILEQLNFHLKAGDWLMVVGPNGAGKSTLVKALGQWLAYDGQIELMGRPIATYSAKDRARQVGVLRQQSLVVDDMTVEELVGLGRYPYRRSYLDSWKESDQAAVVQALDQVGLSDLRQRHIRQLSGGEVQRVFLAQVLAQNPRILLLDEPTNHLDLRYQEELFELIGDWLAQGERVVLSITHDLSLARKYGQTALLLDQGKPLRLGPIEDVMSSKELAQAYQMDVRQWMVDLLGLWEG